MSMIIFLKTYTFLAFVVPVIHYKSRKVRNVLIIILYCLKMISARVTAEIFLAS